MTDPKKDEKQPQAKPKEDPPPTEEVYMTAPIPARPMTPNELVAAATQGALPPPEPVKE